MPAIIDKITIPMMEKIIYLMIPGASVHPSYCAASAANIINDIISSPFPKNPDESMH
jgi:hypothetical protein